MNAGDEVRYVGTLPNGLATVIEVGDQLVIDLHGTGHVVCGLDDVQPLAMGDLVSDDAAEEPSGEAGDGR